MIPGPIVIRKCSKCSQLIEEDTIISGNTFGATFWTDGKVDAPMLPDHPWLVECPHCQTLLWIDEQEQLGEISLGEPESDQFQGSRPCEAPSADRYFRLLDKGISDPEKERYVRLRAWWAGNDKRRKTRVKPALSEKEIKNLRKFAKILDETDANDRLMKAEIMRELCRFDDAITLLAGQFEAELSQAVAAIRDLAQKKKWVVTKMRFN